MAMRTKVRRGPPPSVAKKTAAKVDLKPAAQDAFAPKFNSLIGVAVAKSRRTLPRGAKFVIRGGTAQLRVDTKYTGTVLFEGSADDVARWALRKLGYKAEIKPA